MKKNVKRFLFVLLPIFVVGCANVYKGDDSSLEGKVITPPGETYTPEGEYNLNVVYYVPADDDVRENWHYRLSGISLYIQKYFSENLRRYYINKKFGLVLNDVNPEFVKIHYIKSKRVASSMQVKDMGDMSREILDYFNANPEEKTSDNFLVFMPNYNGAFYDCSYPGNNVSMAFCGCDNEKFSMIYFESVRARAKNLPPLGRVLYQTGRAFFLAGNTHVKSDAFLALMGVNKYATNLIGDPYTYNYVAFSGTFTTYLVAAGVPDKIRLTETDVRMLENFQIFQEKEFTPTPLEVKIEEVKIACLKDVVIAEDSIFVTCRFSSPDEITGVTMYHDPWTMYANGLPAPELDENPTFESGVDAATIYLNHVFFKDLGNSTYEASFKIAMAAQLIPFSSTTTTSEIRFRFIGKGGMCYPQSPDIKGADDKLRYKYSISFDKVTKIYSHDIATRYGVKEE